MAKGRGGCPAEKRTCCPSSMPISSLTRLATLMAATRLGWVHPTIPNSV